MAKQRSLKDRYVVEDGIPRIRPLHPHTKLPLATEKEKKEAIQRYIVARREIDAGFMSEEVAMVEFEVDFTVNPITGEKR